MKKYIFIILSFFFALFAKADTSLTVTKKITAAVPAHHAESFSHTHISFPNEDVELSTSNGNNATQGNHSIQKDISYPGNLCFTIPAKPGKPLAVCYAAPQLFNNSCLFYNYPSHNFW